MSSYWIFEELGRLMENTPFNKSADPFTHRRDNKNAMNAGMQPTPGGQDPGGTEKPADSDTTADPAHTEQPSWSAIVEVIETLD